jgi:chemotaxis protein CheC
MVSAVELIARKSIDRASQILSKAIRLGAKIEFLEVIESDISQITSKMSDQDQSVIASLIQLTQDTKWNVLFTVPLKDALILTDLFIRKPVGTTTEFNIYVESTIQELGNMMASSICNTFSADFNLLLKPSPPLVMKDYEAAIFSDLLLMENEIEDKIFLIHTRFLVVKYEMTCKLYLLPQKGSLQVLDFFLGAV